MKIVTITTDGACWPNPGPGGWAAVLRFGEAFREISGFEARTTNNRMELKAVVEAVRCLKEPCQLVIRTDSKNTIAWCAPSGFKKKKKQAAFPEAWAMVQDFRTLAAKHVVSWEWVRGHTGDPDNERCDQLAEDQARRPF